MTWAKFGTEFPDEMANLGLSDAAYRTHSEAIMYLFRVESTTMRIPKNVVRRFAGSLDYEQAIKELVALRLWRDRGTDWEVIHTATTIRQGIQAQLHKRDEDRERQRRHRKHKAGNHSLCSPDNCGFVTADVTRDVRATQTDSQPLSSRGAGGDENKSPLRAIPPRATGIER